MVRALKHDWTSYLRAAGMLGHSKHENTRFRDPKIRGLNWPIQPKVK